LEVEAQELFNSKMTNLEVSILKSITIQSLKDFINHWKHELWEASFFVNLNKKVQYSKARPGTNKQMVKKHSNVLSTSNKPNLCFYSPQLFMPLNSHIEFNWCLQVFFARTLSQPGYSDLSLTSEDLV
jgi:hypothetical protein